MMIRYHFLLRFLICLILIFFFFVRIFDEYPIIASQWKVQRKMECQKNGNSYSANRFCEMMMIKRIVWWFIVYTVWIFWWWFGSISNNIFQWINNLFLKSFIYMAFFFFFFFASKMSKVFMDLIFKSDNNLTFSNGKWWPKIQNQKKNQFCIIRRYY